MSRNMTPSEMTQGQINKAVANYRALLEKHSGKFGAAAVQQALGQSELADEQFAVFRRRVEIFSNYIVRHTKVDRRRSSPAALDATSRRQYANAEVVNGMPVGDGDEVDVVFFKPEPWEYTRLNNMNDDDFEKALARRGLMSDPRAAIAANEDDPAFADNHPNSAHWKDADNWCFVAFGCWGGRRGVDVLRSYYGWPVCWWFSGVRK